MLESIEALGGELDKFRESFPELLGIIIINDEGMPLFASLSDTEDESAYGGAVAEFLVSSSRISSFLSEDNAQTMLLKLPNSYFITLSLSEGLVLGARFSSESRLGIAYTATQFIANRLNKVLAGEE